MRPVSHNAFQAALCSASNFSFALKKRRIYSTNFQFFLPEDVTYDLKLESSCFAANTILNIERNAELSRTVVRLFVVLFIQCSL